MPRFVILEHDWPALHYDLMIESGSMLRTWRMHELPTPGRETNAEPIGNHRLEYLDYEGPISGGRGSVKRVDCGTFEFVQDHEHRIVLAVFGDRIRGQIEIVW